MVGSTRSPHDAPDGRFDTADLIARLPAPSASLRGVLSTKGPDGREVPTSIPLHHAVALAAAACARSRGAKRFKTVYEHVRALGDRQREYLVVLRPGKPPEIVRAAGFTSAAAIVLDLAEIRADVLAGTPITH